MHFLAYKEKSLACAKIKENQFEDTSTDGKLSIITMMDEIQWKLEWKQEIEYSDSSKLLTLFGLFGLSVFLRKDQDLGFFYIVVLLKNVVE